MIFSRRGAYYQASRVTGPTHNFLSVLLTAGPDDIQPQVEMLPGFCDGHGDLDPTKIVHSVLEGLDQANHKLGTKYKVSRIQYRSGDNPPEVIYGVLMIKIIERLASGEEFREGEPRDE